MKKVKQLNQTWIKAAVLGTIWAASEIVLGSFLHNIRFPFSGNILVGIAMILLIAASYIWKEKGIIWRAGIICALLKTMSPSAVIFGPMVAIFMEAVLLEMSLRIFKHQKTAYLVGAALAMSWNLFHKIFNMILFYGMSIVKVYEKILHYAQKQLHWNFDIVWFPLISLLIIYIILGVLAAKIGMKTGKNLISKDYKLEIQLNPANKNEHHFIKHKLEVFNYSIIWLIGNTVLSVSLLVLHKYLSFQYWSILVILAIAVWSWRYKRALRQVMKPKFWIWFVALTMFTALLMTDKNESGLIIGITMNLRALLLITSFTVLGTELYNPKIKAFFNNGKYHQLAMALELSLASLPQAISNLPSVKTIFKHPTAVFYTLLKDADDKLKDHG